MKKKVNVPRALQYVLVMVSLLMMGTGIANNETQIVLAKAINICLECIGIG